MKSYIAKPAEVERKWYVVDAEGKTLGRPALTCEQLPDAFFRHYHLYINKDISKKEYARLIGVSRPTLDKYLRIVSTQE